MYINYLIKLSIIIGSLLLSFVVQGASFNSDSAKLNIKVTPTIIIQYKGDTHNYYSKNKILTQ